MKVLWFKYGSRPLITSYFAARGVFWLTCGLNMGVVLRRFLISQLAERAGVPTGVINVVTSSRANGAVIGETLCASTLVQKISFTGSTVVGKVRKVCHISRILNFNRQMSHEKQDGLWLYRQDDAQQTQT